MLIEIEVSNDDGNETKDFKELKRERKRASERVDRQQRNTESLSKVKQWLSDFMFHETKDNNLKPSTSSICFNTTFT